MTASTKTEIAVEVPPDLRSSMLDVDGGLGSAWQSPALLLLLLIALIAVWLRRRLAGVGRTAKANAPIAIAGTVKLSETVKLSIVRYGNREFLIAHGPQAASLLHDRAAAATPPHHHPIENRGAI